MRAEIANPDVPERFSRGLALILPVLLALMLGLFAVSATPQAQHSSAASPSTSKSATNLNAVVRDILQNELRAQAEDHSLWCYRKLTDKDGKQQLFAACQTKTLEIDRLMAVNGKPLTEQQWNQENQRIEQLLNNRSQLKKEKQQQREDGEQATHLLKMLPEAFLFQQESSEGNRITLHFTPNPTFRASGSSEMVFHHMEGTLTLDLIPRNVKKTITRPRTNTNLITSLQRQETPLQALLHKHSPKNPKAKRPTNPQRGEKIFSITNKRTTKHSLHVN